MVGFNFSMVDDGVGESTLVTGCGWGGPMVPLLSYQESSAPSQDAKGGAIPFSGSMSRFSFVGCGVLVSLLL